MRNRTGLVLIGAAVAILGYALLYSGLSTLNPSITPSGAPVGVLASLSPAASASAGDARRRAKSKGPPPGPGGRRKQQV